MRIDYDTCTGKFFSGVPFGHVYRDAESRKAALERFCDAYHSSMPDNWFHTLQWLDTPIVDPKSNVPHMADKILGSGKDLDSFIEKLLGDKVFTALHPEKKRIFNVDTMKASGKKVTSEQLELFGGESK